jgi:hypothetical protein
MLKGNGVFYLSIWLTTQDKFLISIFRLIHIHNSDGDSTELGRKLYVITGDNCSELVLKREVFHSFVFPLSIIWEYCHVWTNIKDCVESFSFVFNCK